MRQREIGRKYSLALFQLGKEKDKLFDFKRELLEIKNILKNKELKDFLFHPQIKTEDKKKLLQKVFSDMSTLLANFLNLLFDKRRAIYLDDIIEEFINLVKEEEKILEVEVITAIELSENLITELKNTLSKKLDNQIELVTRIDSSIIAGMIIKIGDQIIDGSIKNSLNSLADNLTGLAVSELGV